MPKPATSQRRAQGKNVPDVVIFVLARRGEFWHCVDIGTRNGVTQMTNGTAPAAPKPVAQMTDVEVQRLRRWPAHLTTAQMRAQIEWEQSPEFRRVGA